MRHLTSRVAVWEHTLSRFIVEEPRSVKSQSGMLCWDVYSVWRYQLGKCYLETHRCASQCCNSKQVNIANNSSPWGPLRIKRLTSKNSGSTNITPKCMVLLSINRLLLKWPLKGLYFFFNGGNWVLAVERRYGNAGFVQTPFLLLYLYVLVNCFCVWSPQCQLFLGVTVAQPAIA